MSSVLLPLRRLTLPLTTTAASAAASSSSSSSLASTSSLAATAAAAAGGARRSIALARPSPIVKSKKPSRRPPATAAAKWSSHGSSSSGGGGDPALAGATAKRAGGAAGRGKVDERLAMAMGLAEAYRILRAWEITKPWSSLILTAKVLPDKAKPSMRGRTAFGRDPKTKPEVVYVFCKGADVGKALQAGAAMAGGDELVDKILNGLVPLPTASLATPAMAPTLAANRALTRLLGPRGLLPQLKRGTVVEDVGRAVGELKGVLDWRVSKQQLLQAAVGKPDFSLAELEQNVLALVGDLRKCGTVAATFDGQDVNYTTITRLSLKSTNGPDIVLNDVLPKVLRLEAEALAADS